MSAKLPRRHDINQVIAEFTRIASFAGDSKQIPDPANTVSGSLGITNLDVLNFVPAVCAYPNMSFYDTLLFKAIGPLVVLAALWIWPFILAIKRKPRASATQQAAKLSLRWLELVYISVSTTILQCFMCENIDNNFYLRANLTLPCNGTGRRQAHVLFAALMVLTYPIGEAAFSC